MTKEEEVQQRWKEYFVELLNRPNPEREVKVISDMEVIEEIPSGPITKAEIRSAIASMKAGKAPSVEVHTQCLSSCLTVELLKADITITVYILHDLFCEIWVSETAPAYWRRGLIVKIAKKGDLTKCGNWRGITLMSVAAKVMGKVLIRRIPGGVDAKLKMEQAGFRKGRSTIERIFVLRNVVEQAVEWNSSLYVHVRFVDYEKAFDSTFTGKLCGRSWRVMGYLRILSGWSTQCMMVANARLLRAQVKLTGLM